MAKQSKEEKKKQYTDRAEEMFDGPSGSMKWIQYSDEERATLTTYKNQLQKIINNRLDVNWRNCRITANCGVGVENSKMCVTIFASDMRFEKANKNKKTIRIGGQMYTPREAYKKVADIGRKRGLPVKRVNWVDESLRVHFE